MGVEVGSESSLFWWMKERRTLRIIRLSRPTSLPCSEMIHGCEKKGERDEIWGERESQKGLSCSNTNILLSNLVTDNIKKTKHLTDLPHAKERLTLWKADLSDEGSFDEAISGCTGVFHVATPMDFLSQDPEVSSLVIGGNLQPGSDLSAICVHTSNGRPCSYLETPN